ncbi:hypothetical protein, partial [Bradyrhizobium sp.]|uniref:hypothetical protein n=1 Tax=Bradyrhizobium sp. TaxID=376 RepID=UPI003C6B38D2
SSNPPTDTISPDEAALPTSASQTPYRPREAEAGSPSKFLLSGLSKNAATLTFHPQTGKQVVMPLKVGTVVPVSHENPLSDAFGTELTVLNHMMQTTLGR